MRVIKRDKGVVRIETYYENATFETDEYGEHASVPYKVYIRGELVGDMVCRMTIEEYREESAKYLR